MTLTLKILQVANVTFKFEVQLEKTQKILGHNFKHSTLTNSGNSY